MRWSFAKNIMIVLMIILNIALFIIKTTQDNKNYTLNFEAESNIKNVLADSNIFIYTTLPKSFEPMKSVEMIRRNIDSEVIIEHFLKDKTNVKKANDGNKEIYYKDENEYIEIYRNGMVRYIKTLDNTEKDEITREEAYEILTDFIPRVYKGNAFYKPTFYNKENDKYIYIYYNTYKNALVLNDYIKTVISKDKIEVEVWGADITGFVNNKANVISVDEALYNFMKKVKFDNAYITSVELGYYTLNDNLVINDAVIAEPYYKISVMYSGDYFVNAYTNQIYDQNLLEISN